MCVFELVTIILSNLNRLKNTGRFLGEFVVKWVLKIQPHLEYIATLYIVKRSCQQNKPLTTNYKVV